VAAYDRPLQCPSAPSSHALLIADVGSNLQAALHYSDGSLRLELYEKSFRAALHKPPRHSSPINVLMHALGYFKKELSVREKRHFLEVLEAYRHGRTPLGSAVSILRSWVMRFESEYLRDQTFFSPFPEELMALDDSGGGRA
jgi:uncharacterized protein YbgA (DUF1722 family)